MCLNFTSIILIIQILRFSLGSQVQNLFSCANRGSKADYGRMPYLNRFENKSLGLLDVAEFDILVRNDFSLDPHNGRT